MAKGDGHGHGHGGGGAPGQVYLPAWRRAYDRLVKMLREAYAQAEELSAEREHLIAEIEFLRSSRRERDEIYQTRLQKIREHDARSKRIVEADAAVLLDGKEQQIRRYRKLAELTDNDLEDFRSCISNLAAENTELQEKLKKAESQTELHNNSDHQHSGKDHRAELRKLKQAYKTLRSEKDKEISALQAEKSFVWNQLKTMEQEYSGTIKNKKIEVKQATEAAQKLLQNVDELQVVTRKKDDEICRLQVEVTNAKARMLILEDELQKMRFLVKDKDVETDKNKDDQPETSRKLKKDKANRKSKSTITPDICEVKTSRVHVSQISQKRKRSTSKSSSFSCGNRGFSTKLLLVKATVSPMLLPPSFTVPRLKTPTLPKHDETIGRCSLL